MIKIIHVSLKITEFGLDKQKKWIYNRDMNKFTQQPSTNNYTPASEWCRGVRL